MRRIKWSDWSRWSLRLIAETRWLSVSAAVILFDQVTKQVALAALRPHEIVPISPFARVLLVYNSGIVRGWLTFAGNEQRWPLVSLAIVVATVLAVLIIRNAGKDYHLLAGMALVLGGALSNAIDRIVFAHVIDLVQLSYGGWSTAVFNAADLAIFVGLGMIVGYVQSEDPKRSGTAV